MIEVIDLSAVSISAPRPRRPLAAMVTVQDLPAEALTELDEGAIGKLIRRLGALAPINAAQRQIVEREIAYFDTSVGRTVYGKFPAAGLFVGSGMVEPGCKTLIGQRLKVSGARWTVRGTGAIACLRYFKVSGRWERLWVYSGFTQT